MPPLPQSRVSRTISAFYLTSLNLHVADVVQRIKEYILAHPEIENDKSRWIEGMGWDQTKWLGAEFPTAVCIRMTTSLNPLTISLQSDLDQDPLLKGRPISLSRVDVHARWVSPRVLELMGDLPSKVEGGQIIRDGAGNPTGELYHHS